LNHIWAVNIMHPNLMTRCCRPAAVFARFAGRNQPRFSTSPTFSSQSISPEAILEKPNWSVAALLSPKQSSSEAPVITTQQLHHLLRLSALPMPRSDEEEREMLETLASQLRFVQEIQSVDTTGVEPLQSLRDETKAGEQEAEIGLATLEEALSQEDIRGTHHRRIRRRTDPSAGDRAESWDVLGAARKRVGPYFVVEGGDKK
jgi:aspartyl/glutamyl-tRNA(Asn/Gln) amidotransferase C subunit